MKITHEGDDTLANIKLGEVRVVNWTAKDGTKLEGIATFPSNFSAGQKSKFLVLPHGGPEANDNFASINSRACWREWATWCCSRNIAVPPDTAPIFSRRFISISATAPISDVDSATDFAIAQGWADPNKLAIFGWSAGGFMTSWTVTQTHRYKAAIEGAGITGLVELHPNQ